MNKNTLYIGFMLFAIFFGAGNLIFPPQLGAESGSQLTPALLGFLVTAIGLPMVGLLCSAATPGGAIGATANVHPAFRLVMVGLVFVLLGPMFAVPRTSATAYEMSLVSFVGPNNALALLLWTVAYFGISGWISLNPSKMVERVGQLLTPALLLAIFALVTRGVMLYGGNSLQPPTTTYASGAVAAGFLQGYQTMDAFATFDLALVVAAAVRAANPPETNARVLLRQSVTAGLIAAALLALVYGGLAWMGAHMSTPADQMAALVASGEHLGSRLLVTAANDLFGGGGRVLLGVIVTLACLTMAAAQYLSDNFKNLDYRKTVLAISLCGLTLANLGLSRLMSIIDPILLVLYPIVIAIVSLMLLARIVKTPRLAWRLGVLFAGTIGLLSTVNGLGWLNLPFVQRLPLAGHSLEWLPFMLLGVVLGWLFGQNGEHVDYAPQTDDQLKENALQSS